MSFFLLAIMFKYIKDETFINLLFVLLFVDKTNEKLMNYIIEYPNPPKCYSFEWGIGKLNENNQPFTNCMYTITL